MEELKVLNEIILVVPHFSIDRNRGYWPFFAVLPKNKQKLLEQYGEEVVYTSFDGEETTDYSINHFYSTPERIQRKIRLAVLKKVFKDDDYLEIRNNLERDGGVGAIIVIKNTNIASMYHLLAITRRQDTDELTKRLSLTREDQIQQFEFYFYKKSGFCTGYWGSCKNGKNGPGCLW